MEGGPWLRHSKEPTRPLPPAASPPCTATGTLSIEILEVNDHAPELSPPSGSVCSKPEQGSGLLLGATDEDLPPHGAPFHFQLSPRVPELTRNWSLTPINGELSQPPAQGARSETWGEPHTVVPLVPPPSGQMGKRRPQVSPSPPSSQGRPGRTGWGWGGDWLGPEAPADLGRPPQ